MVRLMLFVQSFRTMYYACRTDYPCEGCEMGRLASLRGALSWARRMTR